MTAYYIANKPTHLVSRQERQAYKAVNLGHICGMGATGLQQTAKQSYGVEMTMGAANLFRRRFFETYDGILLPTVGQTSNPAVSLPGHFLF